MSALLHNNMNRDFLSCHAAYSFMPKVMESQILDPCRPSRCRPRILHVASFDRKEAPFTVKLIKRSFCGCGEENSPFFAVFCIGQMDKITVNPRSFDANQLS